MAQNRFSCYFNTDTRLLLVQEIIGTIFQKWIKALKCVNLSLWSHESEKQNTFRHLNFLFFPTYEKCILLPNLISGSKLEIFLLSCF